MIMLSFLLLLFQVLMRALRDFNIPKIVTDDLPVFMGLIGDLFPALDVPRKRDLDFEKQIKDAVLALHLQPEDGFVLKVRPLFRTYFVGLDVVIISRQRHIFSSTQKFSVVQTRLQYI